MARQKKPLAARLITCKISEEQFNSWQCTLKSYGFTDAQTDSICVRRSSKNSVEALIAELNKRESQLLRNFTTEQVKRIVSKNGGSNNLKAVTDNFGALQTLGFNAEQIVRMVSHDGGSKNLEAVKTNFCTLKDLKFNAGQIVRMVSNNGGSKNLEAVKTNFCTLKALTFNVKQIVRMVSCNSGHMKLGRILDPNLRDKIASVGAEKIASWVSHYPPQKIVSVNTHPPYNPQFFSAQPQSLGADTVELELMSFERDFNEMLEAAPAQTLGFS